MPPLVSYCILLIRILETFHYLVCTPNYNVIVQAGSLLMAKARQSFHNGSGIPKKKGVTIFGRQPDSSIWAISPDIFIDEQTGSKYNNYFIDLYI